MSRLSILTWSNRTGSLSAPKIVSSLENTVGDNEIMSAIKSICVALDQELGASSEHLGVKVGEIPKFRKKTGKKDHSVLIIHLYDLYCKLQRAVSMRKEDWH